VETSTKRSTERSTTRPIHHDQLKCHQRTYQPLGLISSTRAVLETRARPARPSRSTHKVWRQSTAETRLSGTALWTETARSLRTIPPTSARLSKTPATPRGSLWASRLECVPRSAQQFQRRIF